MFLSVLLPPVLFEKSKLKGEMHNNVKRRERKVHVRKFSCLLLNSLLKSAN